MSAGARREEHFPMIFAPPAPPEVREIHADMEGRATEPMQLWRDWLRGYAEAHLAPVSTDDLWRAMERGLVPQIPEGTHPNVLGSVFSGDPRGWRRVDVVRSKRAGANGNYISQWRPMRKVAP